MDNFGDPKYEYHKAMTQLLCFIGYMITSNPIIPFNQSDTAQFLQSNTEILKKQVESIFPDASLFSKFDFKSLENAISKFSKNAEFVNKYISKNENKSPEEEGNEKLAQEFLDLNLVLILTERSFIVPQGLPRRPFYKHLLQASGFYKGYGSDP